MNKIKAFFNKKKNDNVNSDDIEANADNDLVTNTLMEDNDAFKNSVNIQQHSITITKSSVVSTSTDKTTVNRSELLNSDELVTTSNNIPITEQHHSSNSLFSLSSDDSFESDLEEEDNPELQFGDTTFKEQIELKDYKLIEKIGEGAFSRVFKAVPLSPQISKQFKYVAIKVIKKDNLIKSSSLSPEEGNKGKQPHRKRTNSIKSSSREQVLKEVSLHKSISNSCPYIVQFVDFKESNTYYYIVQEMMKGGEIFNEIVRLTYFSEDLCRHVIKQLAIAVKHLHALGIVHRDIKPENLLFNPIDYVANPKPVLRKSDDPNTKRDEGIFIPNVGGGSIGLVKLTDFGLSKQIFQTNTMTPCGTVGYTAPEVVKDERYSMQVDMWGIGCVLYTMLCGFPPFYDEKIDILTEKISRGEYVFLQPWWDEISDGAKNCVRNLLEVDPLKRYNVDQFLNDPWLNTFDCEKNNNKNVMVPKNQKKKKKKTSRAHRRNFYNGTDASFLYSPAAVAMRDAFDVSNAVQRLEEEKKRKNSVPLCSLNEEDEISTFDGQNSPLDEKLFQLTLNASTIVKRRNQKRQHLLQTNANNNKSDQMIPEELN